MLCVCVCVNGVLYYQMKRNILKNNQNIKTINKTVLSVRHLTSSWDKKTRIKPNNFPNLNILEDKYLDSNHLL